MNAPLNLRRQSFKQRVGVWMILRLPINRHIFDHLRLELNAVWVRTLHRFRPRYRRAIKALSRRSKLKANIGCGPFGQSGWVNLDLFSHEQVTLRADCRYQIPLADRSCQGIHVEHFFEHLCPSDERERFLRECRRCLQDNGVLRIVVPDAEIYVRAYVQPGWKSLNEISCGGDVPELAFRTKMEALNHVFLQGAEHYGGYDAETLLLVLQEAGFRNVARRSWREGDFPDGPIDRDLHRPYSLYFEGRR
jgi:predicted SAM-dependent methyltransferase